MHESCDYVFLYFEKLKFSELHETPDVSAALADQYAFSPTGSTTAALVHILHDISEMIQSYPYVHILALDFSKAFDSVKHKTLMTKLELFHLVDNVYNWLIDYLSGRSHCRPTMVNNLMSSALPINASIFQGSSVGLVSFIANSSDLKAKTLGNKLLEYADDYLPYPVIQGQLNFVRVGTHCCIGF